MAFDAEQGLDAARKNMVDRQVRPSDVTRPDLLSAMETIPRETFFPKSRRALAYVGEHVEIGDGRVELDPRVFAKMVEAGAPGREDLALVIGSGYGYAAAVLSQLCAAVVTVDPAQTMTAAAEAAYRAIGADNIVSATSPLEEGCVKHAPFNLVFVNGGLTGAPPQALLDQLSDGGRLVCIRMEGALGRCEVWVRSGDVFGRRDVFDAAAPLLPGMAQPPGFEF